MLRIAIPEQEYYSSSTGEFITIPGDTLILEHSLKSLALWESKWNRSFTNDGPKNVEETVDYIKCMTVNEKVDHRVYLGLTDSMLQAVNHYLTLPMTATTFSKTNAAPPSRRALTAELIYWKMLIHGIPFECENWNLNRLTALIRVCDIRSAPPKKMNQRDAAKQMRSLNAARRQQLNTRG